MAIKQVQTKAAAKSPVKKNNTDTGAVNKTNVVKASSDGDSIIINNLVLRTAQRASADINKWREVHRSAESVFGTGARVGYYDLCDDVQLDAHLSAVIDKRIMSITNHSLKFLRDNKEVEEVSKLIKSKGFREVLREMMLAKFWGISLIELTKDAEGNLFPYSIPRKHIRPRTQHIVNEQYAIETSGINYREGIYLNTCIEVGAPNDLGLLLKAIPFVIYKRGCWGNWAQYTEVFGMPTKIGRYSGYDEATRIALEAALDEAGSALSIVLPEEAKLEFLESKTTAASGNLYKDLANACDEQISILILGNTETTKSSASSGYAQSSTHAGQQQQIADDDRAWILGYLETEVRRVLKSMGYPMDGGEWQWEAEQEHVSLLDRVAIDAALKASGLPIDDDYFYEKYSIPKPANYEAVKKTAAEATGKKAEQDELDKNEEAKKTDAKKVADDNAGTDKKAADEEAKKAADKLAKKDKKISLQGLGQDDLVTLTVKDLTDFFGLATPTV